MPTADADVPRAIENLEMGFLPLPSFSPKDASTSFKVRGRGVRLDLVTPGDGERSGRPVHVARFKTSAAPVRLAIRTSPRQRMGAGARSRHRAGPQTRASPRGSAGEARAAMSGQSYAAKYNLRITTAGDAEQGGTRPRRGAP